jgi:hypothetical protein
MIIKLVNVTMPPEVVRTRASSTVFVKASSRVNRDLGGIVALQTAEEYRKKRQGSGAQSSARYQGRSWSWDCAGVVVRGPCGLVELRQATRGRASDGFHGAMAAALERRGSEEEQRKERALAVLANVYHYQRKKKKKKRTEHSALPVIRRLRLN